MSNFWEFFWSTFFIFAFVAYLMILFSILTDLFRDRHLNGWLKAIWIIFLIWIPYLTALIYLIARGRGMAERQERVAERHHEAASAYARDLAGTSPATEIAQAKKLLDEGILSNEEFATLKARALAR